MYFPSWFKKKLFTQIYLNPISQLLLVLKNYREKSVKSTIL